MTLVGASMLIITVYSVCLIYAQEQRGRFFQKCINFTVFTPKLRLLWWGGGFTSSGQLLLQMPHTNFFFFLGLFDYVEKTYCYCVFLLFFFFLDTFWSNILNKRQTAGKKYYYICVENSSAIKMRHCQLPVPAHPVSRRQFVFYI